MTVTPALRAQELLGQLRSLADPANVAGMARFGISSEGTLGVSVSQVRVMAREVKREAGRDGGTWRHEVALALWESGVHEARMLAGIVDDATLVTPQQMERQVRDLDSWDLCDGLMLNLYRHTPYAYETAIAWTGRDEEFVKRAGFVLLATLAVHEKSWPDERFVAVLPLVEREASDQRNMVKKAVNWTLRQIGKRNATLHAPALACAERLSASSDATARWVGKDAARELRSR